MRSNKGALEISFSMVVALLIAAVIMFGVPLYITAQKNDKAIETSVKSSTDELVSKIAVAGKLTQQDLDNYQLTIDSTGYHWDYDITVQKLDENPSKKQVSLTKDGKTYYIMYDTQVRDEVNEKGSMELNPGDQVTITATINSKTMTDQLADATIKSRK